jgi:hypothetical protein
MANSTVNLAKFPYGQGGRNVTLPVDGGTHIYDGTMVAQLTATAMLVPGSTAASGHCIGVADHEQDNTGADAALRCKIVTDKIFLFANGTSTNACSEATPLGSAVYMFDDHTVYDNSAGDTLKRAGYFMGLEPDSGGKVRVFITPLDFGSAMDVGESDAMSVHGVRGASTANIADLAVFTVAGVDGLTYVAGERILLKDQSTATQNGIYVVGTVGGGTAALTRALDADGADEVVPGMLVHVSEGTVALNSWWALTTNAAITIGSSNLTFAQIPTHANLAATSGAGLIGILDTAGAITATNVETALAEIAAIVSPGGVTKIQVVTGTLVGGTATITVGAGQAVTAATKAFPVMSAVVTGSANFGSLAHLIASNVVGGSGVGQVVIRALGNDGAQDVDAAGLFAAILIN